MNSLSAKVNSLKWRRDKVLELASQGYSQPEISRILQISQSTINRDISYLRQQAKDNIRKFIDEKLPEEYQKCLVGITSILKEAWTTSHKTEDNKEKISALSLAKECYSMKLDLLTNANVIEDAIRFVSSQREEKAKVNASVIKDQGQDNRSSTNDIQGSEQENQQQQQQIRTANKTTNQTF